MDPATIRAKIASLLVEINAVVAKLQEYHASTNTPDTPLSPVYLAAKDCLDKRITLDPSVPPDLGCAEAVSYVLNRAGVVLPSSKGFAGTAALYDWLKINAQQITTPEPGDVIISPTGTSTLGSPHGHVGIVAQYGVLSNDSDTGLFREKYTLTTWQQYFQAKLGFPVYFFRINNL